MTKKTSATVKRTTQAGTFVVRKNGGSDTSVHSASAKTVASVSTSIARNRDALKRLADR